MAITPFEDMPFLFICQISLLFHLNLRIIVYTIYIHTSLQRSTFLNILSKEDNFTITTILVKNRKNAKTNVKS